MLPQDPSDLRLQDPSDLLLQDPSDCCQTIVLQEYYLDVIRAELAARVAGESSCDDV